METIDARSDELDPAAQIRELERSEALPYVIYPPTPRWYPLMMGTWGAGIVVLLSMDADAHRALWISLVLLLTFGVSAVLGALRSRYGAFPVIKKAAPQEIRGAYVRYFLGLPVVVALVALVWWWAGPTAGAIAAFVLVTAAITLYEVTYARAAATTRKRLGIDTSGTA